MMRSGICCLFALLLAVGSPLLSNTPSVRAQVEDEQPEELTGDFVPGQLIIRFKPGVTKEEISDFYTEHGLAERQVLDRDPTDKDEEMRLASVQVTVDVQLLSVLSNDPRVQFVEPNYLIHIDKTPNDPDYSRLWGLNNTGQTGGTNDADTDAPETWDVTTGSPNVIIAVIDTGVDYKHEDLAANMWVNAAECPQGYGKCVANGRDEDGNGYIDDFYGINATNDTGDPMDDYGHGTHVAGTIGAVGNNGIGVAGVNWNVRIVACKFLSASGSGTVASAVKCFQYVYQLKNTQKQNIVATNNSWGGAVVSEALREAMGGAGQPLHICAAGNSNSGQPHYPAGFDLPNIIGVAATDHNDKYASFSNYGADWVDLAAPGVDILSTVPKGSCPLCSPSGYDTVSGTSMATPHVTGAVGLLYAQYPNLTIEQVKQRLLAAVDSLSDRTKLTRTNGRLNLFNTLENDTTPPATVNDLAAAGVLLTKVNLTWSAPGDDGMKGRANGYDLRYSTSPISAANFAQATPVPGAPSPQAPGATEHFTVSGLEPGVTYYFALKASDNVGNLSELSNVVLARTSTGTLVFADDMESGPDKWTTAGSNNLWHLSQLRSNSPVTAWYYGKEDTRNYDTGGSNNGTITTQPIDVVGADDALLTFYEWSQVQTSARLDRTRVQVATDGQNWETVFESHGTENAWVKREVDLSGYITPTGSLQLRFWFDTVDGTSNNFEGWYVDDVQLLTAKLQLPGQQRPTANLVMAATNLLFNPPQPSAGAEVTLHATVLNNGTADANDVIVQFMEITASGMTPIGRPQTISNIPVGGSGTAQVEFETGAIAGERTIQVSVDPNNFVPELNETDNVTSRLLVVTPAAAANLVVRPANIGFEPPLPDPGDQVTIRATIFNTGTIEARNVTVQFNDVTGSTVLPFGEVQTIEVIPPGGSSVVEANFDTAAVEMGPLGARDIEVVVDLNNAIPEISETDNRAERTLRLSSAFAPNLNIQAANIGFDTVAPTAGEVVTIFATILNDGNAVAEQVAVQFMETVGSTSTPIGPQQVIERIPAGGSGVAAIAFDTTDKAGDRKIDVVVDPNNFIAEIRETDNKAQKTLKVTPQPAPNLVMLAGNVNTSPIAPTEGETVTIYATVLNNGMVDAVDVAVQFIDATGGAATPIGGGPGGMQVIPLIRAGGSGVAQVEYPTTNKVGDRALQVVVDPANQIQESDESDNVARDGLRVNPADAPNLVLLANNIQFHPPQPNDSQAVVIHAVVLNNGPVEARRVLVQFLDLTLGSPTPIGAETFIDLIPPGGSGAAEATLDLSLLRSVAVRDRRIQVVVDSNNLISESNENDNAALKILPVSAAPAPNLVMLASNIGFDPPQPTIGEPVTITAIVLNTGAMAAENVVVQVVDISSGRPIPIGAEQVIAAIPVGGSGVAMVQFTNIARQGDFQIRVIVDPNNQIAESDETDNRNTAALRVKAAPTANLMIQPNNIGFSPPLPTAGDTVLVTATILNSGAMTTTDVLVQFVDVTNGAFAPIGEKQTIASIAAGGSATTQVTYETRGRVGERKVQVLVDPHSTVPESNEADNSATQTLVVEAPPAPNLVVQESNIGFNPRPEGMRPSAGELVTITATILNNGQRDATDVAVQFLDVTVSGNAVPIGASQVISAIPAGGSATVQVDYDTTNKPGDRRIQVVVDGANLIPESNDTDNSARKTLKVAPPAAPNLLVQATNIGFEPAAPSPGDQVTVYATVINDGAAPAEEVMVQFMDVTTSGSTVPIGQPQVIANIPAGGSGLAQITYDTTSLLGDRRIQVVVDPNNFIREVKENDNTTQKTLSLVTRAAPNLSISASNIGASPVAPVAGARITLIATVINDGNAPANNVVVQFLDATDTRTMPIGDPQTIDSIPTGGSGAAQVILDTTGMSGVRRIQVIVDPNNFILESRETDNTATRTLTVRLGAMPNLVALAGNIGFNPPNPVEGDQVVVNAVVLNNGSATASDVVVQLMDLTTGTATPIGAPQLIGVIPPGASGAAQMAFPTRDLLAGGPSTRQLQVVVDPNNFIPESDEGDNQATATLEVSPAPAPNLKVLPGNFKFDPPSPQQGNVVTITVTVLNDGNADAQDVVVQFTDITGGSFLPIGTEQTIDTIPAGGSAQLLAFYTTTEEPGEREIQVVVDPGNIVAERDETDNRATQTLVVTPPIIPNLNITPRDLLFDPQLPIAGDLVTVTLTVRNDGTGDADNVVVRILDVTAGELEPIGDDQTIPSLAAGASVVLTTTYDTTDKTGDRRIQVLVDAENTVEESNEEDNRVVKMLRVLSEDERPEPQPNLVVRPENLLFDPITPTVGSPVTITLTVTNSGQAPATDVVVEFVDATGGGAEVIGRALITGTLPAGRNGRARLIYDTTGKQGVRTIEVMADPDNEIEESNEEDNQASGTFTITQGSAVTNTTQTSQTTPLAPPEEPASAEAEALEQPNLTITSEDVAVFRPDYMAVAAMGSDPVTITATLHNTGRIGAGNVAVEFMAMTNQGWQVLGARQVSYLEAGESATVELAIDGALALRVRELRVLIDPQNAIFEANEADNWVSQLVRLAE